METRYSCKDSAVFLRSFRACPAIKSQDTLYHVLWIGSAEICPNLSEMHITHSFGGVQWPKNSWAPFSYSYCFFQGPRNSISLSTLPSAWGCGEQGQTLTIVDALVSFFRALSHPSSLNSLWFSSSPILDFYLTSAVSIPSSHPYLFLDFPYMEICIYSSVHCPLFLITGKCPHQKHSVTEKKCIPLSPCTILARWRKHLVNQTSSFSCGHPTRGATLSACPLSSQLWFLPPFPPDSFSSAYNMTK